jgi:DNA-directed RNA polymerase specialized sigma24 family protein
MDFELLRRFVRNGDQPAFGIVLRRHLDLVYTTALRKAQDEGAAQEISQNVFAALARNAWRFAPGDSLPAWLYKATLLESRQWLRGELRRRRRERTAAELGCEWGRTTISPLWELRTRDLLLARRA